MEKQWSLESIGDDGAQLDFVITRLPCRIGRSKENDLVIANLGLSRVHAVISRDITGQLRLTDENSTNGTFVNRRRIDGYCLLNENDVIHFSSAEFKLRLTLVAQSTEQSFDEMQTMIAPENLALSERFVPNEAEFDELISGYGLSGAAQPIVDAHTRNVVGYELLGRANHPRLPKTPIELFGLAEAMDREIDLSLAFRDFGLNHMAPRIRGNTLFINAHPKETFSEEFFTSLAQLRQNSPELNVVVEIHESAVTDIEELRDSLSGINGIIRPGIVHRIDKDTSGLLIVAKNDIAHQGLAQQIKEHSFTRIYEAVVYGNMKREEGTVDAPIGRHPTDRKRMAVTD